MTAGSSDGPGDDTAIERATAAFRRLVGTDPAVRVRSPGRVNLVGDHTDYNDGLALPMAIDRELAVAAAHRDDGRLRLWSELDGEVVEVETATITKPERWLGWTVYVQGVLRAVAADVDLGALASGADVAIASDLPDGAGLSSSAALELAVARLAAALAGFEHDPARAARWGQVAENDWVGVSTGIMDQVTVAQARAGHAVLLDCASTTWTHVPVPDDVEVVVLDTGARRTLVGSAYDDRRADCEEAARRLGVASLRAIGPDGLGEVERLPDRLAARVRHVVTENARVRIVADGLAAGDLEAVGAALVASHASLRNDYEVSGPELDTMADLANDTEGIGGARMTGGGFAGAVVALARAGRVDLEGLLARYRRVHALPARAHVVRPVDGSGLVQR